jgi:hypothetical protein
MKAWKVSSEVGNVRISSDLAHEVFNVGFRKVPELIEKRIERKKDRAKCAIILVLPKGPHRS